MTSRATWLRLLTACTLACLAGCEQSSYSSPQSDSSDKPPAVIAAEVTENAAPIADSAAEPAASSSSPTGNAEPAETAAQTSTATAETASTEASAAKPKAANLPTEDLTFDDIKFDIEKDGDFERSMLTPEIEKLVGRTIRIRGYILPTFQQSGIRNFVLVRDNLECCFGPGAAIYDCIVVDMVPGQSTDFTTRPVAVEGTFSIRELLDFDGVVRAIYHLEGKSVE